MQAVTFCLWSSDIAWEVFRSHRNKLNGSMTREYGHPTIELWSFGPFVQTGDLVTLIEGSKRLCAIGLPSYRNKLM